MLSSRMVSTLAFLVCVACVSFGQNSNNSEPAQRDLKQAQSDWINAYLRGDVDQVSRFEAEDYTATDETGMVTREQQLDGMKKRQPGDLHMTYEFNEWKTRFYGPVALVTFTATDHSSDPNKPQTIELVGTSVWTKEGGQWKVHHVQYAEMQKK
jgi:ketosteroid isomerase-like protein